MWQIGAEADVLVDSSRLAGERVLLANHTPAPPVSTPAPPLRSVLQVRVHRGRRHPPEIPERLRGGRVARLPKPPRRHRRFITLNEVRVDTPRWELTLDGVGFDDAPATATPRAGTVEDWYYINLTGDTHPMYVHLFMFQVVGRVPFDVDRYVAAATHLPDGIAGGLNPWPFATGALIPADATERGFKDTVKVNPGTFTIVRGRFDLPRGVHAPQTYIHHCHILEHEDNDMMRPFTVAP